MKILILFFIIMFLFGCTGSSLEYPDNLVELIRFNGDIIDVQKKQISSKEELIKYIDAIPLPIIYYGDWFFDNYGLIVTARYGTGSPLSSDRLVVHINPLQNNEFLLNTTKYSSGMPILASPHHWRTKIEDRITVSNVYFSEYPVILVKGDPAYWADSLFKYENRTFTILPVSNGVENAELRFTYTITRTNEKELLQER